MIGAVRRMSQALRPGLAIAGLLAALVGFVLPAPAATQTARGVAPAGQSDYAGLYLRIDPDHVNQYPAFEAVFAHDFVDGAAVMLQWNRIEPAPGQYRFEALDHWVVESIRQHKVLSLGLMAGMHTPAWLYDAPYAVPRNEFRYNRNPQGRAECINLVLPSPWNATFIARYAAAIRALAAHLRGLRLPGAPANVAYDSVRIAKLAGINNTTEELRLNATRGDDGPCHQSDAEATWRDAGFTPQRIVAAWTALSDNIARTFPRAVLSVDIIGPGAFPSIDNHGRIRPRRGPIDALTAQIIAIGASRYRGRFSVQWNALSSAQPTAAVALARAHGAIIGWQMNEFLGPRGGSGCFYGNRREICHSEADFDAMLRNGIERGGRFIEIWAPNATRFAAPLRRAHKSLRDPLRP